MDAAPHSLSVDARLADPLEMSYQWLFDAASEPLLIIEQDTGSVIEANLAASKLLRMPRATVVGAGLLRAFDASSTIALQQALAATRIGGSARAPKVQTRDGRCELSLSCSLFHIGRNESYVLVRLAPALAADADVSERPPSVVFEAIEGAAVGFLVTDSELCVRYANPAFVGMVHGACAEDLQDESLTRWLALTEEDHARLRGQMSGRHAVAVLRARLRCERQSEREVEVHAVAVPDAENPCWGFSIRELRGRAALN
jgi:PAS domain-containing protein